MSHEPSPDSDHRQHGFGLTFIADEPLPGLLAGPVPGHAPVRVHLRHMPDWLPHAGTTSATQIFPTERESHATLVIRRLGDGHVLLDYADETRILVDPAGTSIWATWPDAATLEDTATYLLGPVASLVLRLRGVVPLHASAVEIDGRAIAFAGAAGAGKSTTAAAFDTLGYRVMTDDVTAILADGDVPRVQPSFPRVRLWPESVEGLFGRPDALPLLTPNWNKHYLDTGIGAQHSHEPLALRAVYFLQPRGDVDSEPITRLSPRAGLVALLSNTSANFVLDGRARASDLRTLAWLSAHVSLFALTAPDSFADLPALCRRVAADAARGGDADV